MGVVVKGAHCILVYFPTCLEIMETQSIERKSEKLPGMHYDSNAATP